MTCGRKPGDDLEVLESTVPSLMELETGFLGSGLDWNALFGIGGLFGGGFWGTSEHLDHLFEGVCVCMNKGCWKAISF